MPTYPLTTLAATVTPQGISAPPYSDCLASLQASFQSIYGTDAYIAPDSQDGQMLAIFAKAVSDGNSADVNAFNSFSPASAQGGALSSNVKINGIARAVPSNSQVVLRIGGQVGAVIINGIATDANQTEQWLLPASVTIPPAGTIDVTATAADQGAITAAIGTIVAIATPQLGWQTVTNPSAASAGAPVETDAALRRRQTVSTALPSQTVLEGIRGAVAAVAGVTQVRVYENDTDTTDANGQNPHSIAVMAIGGAAADIANAIMLKKTPGGFTYGSTAVSVTDPTSGVPYTMRYTVPTPVTITAALNIKALAGYTTSVGAAAVAALVAYVNATLIGGGLPGVIEWDGAIVAVKGVAQSSTFKIVSLVLTGPGGAGTPDVPLLFNQTAAMVTGGVTLTVT